MGKSPCSYPLGQLNQNASRTNKLRLFGSYPIEPVGKPARKSMVEFGCVATILLVFETNDAIDSATTYRETIQIGKRMPKFQAVVDGEAKR
jgi:hypothetical protein